MQSPYFTPPRRSSIPSTEPHTPETPTKRGPTRAKRFKPITEDKDGPVPHLRRSKRLSDSKSTLPRTPSSTSKSTPAVKRPRAVRGGERAAPQRLERSRSRDDGLEGLDLTTSDDLALGRIIPAATDEVAGRSHLPKVILAQDKLRHDPWKLLVMTTLLNKTAGRAVRPIFEVLMKRYPTPQALSEASVPDLANLLFPLGLFNQRAASLIRFSCQYLALGWPVSVAPGTAPLPDPDANGKTRHPLNSPLPELQDLDVNVFYGSGVYASDSFRIYSPLLPGEGGPRREGEWLMKRKRAEERCKASCRMVKVGMDKTLGDGSNPETGASSRGPDVEEVDEELSDEDDAGPEEWRFVRAGDKELRRYLRWRWAIEGIEYDFQRGPIIERERDKRRLAWLVDS